MKWLVAGLILLSACASRASAPAERANPYETLRTAYAARDARLAASAYTPGAVLVYDYGTRETYSGTAAIEASFAALFESVSPDDALDLNFRIEQSARSGAEVTDRGVYRLRVGKDFSSYGRFETRRETSQAGAGRFVSDSGTGASIDDFEALPGDVMLAPDEEDLDRAYYGKLAGRYALEDGCSLVVTQSVVRLFVRNTCTQAWRGLYRTSGREWRGGSTVLTETPDVSYVFGGDPVATPTRLTVSAAGGTLTARRADPYSREAISFTAPDGTMLAGDLYRPASPSGSGTVLIHGSGPQDRNGYASIMAVMADALAADGHIVLTFDKRGAGASGGDGERSGFGVLAADVSAGITRLRSEPGIDPARIGVAGSSQAGWVAAKLVESGASPAHVYLLGAAGTALTVPEQNLYNTEVRMRCAGIAEPSIALALRQQSAFFDFVLGKSDGAALDSITAAAARRPELADWLFPASREIDFSAGNWFTTLELDFDPLPVWQNYQGEARFVFAEHDDSTPTARARDRLAALSMSSVPDIEISVLPGSQHLGLSAGGLCDAELGASTGFSGALFDTLEGLGAP